MQNALAVYTAKRSINGRKLSEIGKTAGIDLCYLTLGGYLLGSPDEIQSKALTTVYGGALLLVGFFESEPEALVEFGKLIEQANRESTAEKINAGQLPWCELYSKKFYYAKDIKQYPKNKPKLDGSATKQQLPLLKAAKTRYIVYNQSRRKNSGELMKGLAEALAQTTEGIVANFRR